MSKLFSSEQEVDTIFNFLELEVESYKAGSPTLKKERVYVYIYSRFALRKWHQGATQFYEIT